MLVENRKLFLALSHLMHSYGMARFEFRKKSFADSGSRILLGSDGVGCDISMHYFESVSACNGRMDGMMPIPGVCIASYADPL